MLLALLALIWVFGHLGFQSRLQCLRPRIRHAVSWAVIGLLSLYLILLPPHLIHHLTGPQAEGQQCTLFVQGNTSDQEGAEPVPLVVSPSLAGTMANCPAPPALVFPIPTRSGRSPPHLWI